jgi:SSS family solute:Na+ symporter
MELSVTDWGFIVGFFLLSLSIGLIVARRSGRNTTEYFLSGRNMPWWLLGISMVATTFSADTPNLVTDIVRKNGVAGNWVWWAFLLTGMLTVFVYARLWRRSGVLTDLEFYELRYHGKAASFLRGFRAIYLGLFFNVVIMATVTLAAIKIGGVLLGLSPLQTVLIASVVTVIYTMLGGLRGVIWTDFFQFIMAMIGTVWAAVVVVNRPEVGGLTELISHPQVAGKLSLLPLFENPDVYIPLLILPLAVQWWSVWYPGAEPGGGGYVAQRMLSAKDEKNALWATLLFNIAHYALRPWPWILIALASLVIFPDLESLGAAFPQISEKVLNDDLAYSAMLTFLPHGLLGLVIASLIAAYMSTISTHLNWGASYIVHDFYRRFVQPDAEEKELVQIGRLATLVLMVLSATLALYLSNALQAFNILLQIGAGTGLIFILRWFWWRINAFSELAAMIISFLIALVFEFGFTEEELPTHTRLLLGVAITTLTWLVVTLLTRPTDQSTLLKFYQKIKPHGMGWKPVINKGLAAGALVKDEVTTGQLPRELAAMFLGVFLVYSILFGTGYFLYGQMASAAIALVSGTLLWRVAIK